MKRSPLNRKTPLKRGYKKTYRPNTQTKVLDDLVRRIVLIRDGFHCCKCGQGVVSGGGPGKALQAAHIKPKGAYPALRHEILNVIVLCASCHLYGRGAWHKDPIAAIEWVRGHLGQPYLDHLEFLARTRTKVDKSAEVIYLAAKLSGLNESEPPTA